MAAYYPKEPTPVQKTLMVNFFEAFKEFYPCTYCAKDLRKEMQKSKEYN
jgi:FAD-linked sulfhydryl oxidase